MKLNAEEVATTVAENVPDNRMWLEMGIDLDNRSFELRGEISSDMVAFALRALTKLVQMGPEPIVIYLNSPGGSIYDGLAIHDLIIACPCHVTVVGLGHVMSMAPIVMLAADTRVALPNTRFMVHAPIFMRERETSVDVQEEEVVEAQFCKQAMLKILAQRTNKSVKFWSEKMTKKDYYFGLDEAIKYGIVSKPKKKRKK